MSNASRRAEVDELIGLSLDGAPLSDAQQDRLRTLLLADPELLDQYVVTTALANDLRHVASLAVSTDGEAQTRAGLAGRRGTGRTAPHDLGIALLALAASIAAVVISIGWATRGGVPGGAASGVNPEFVATVVSQKGWEHSTVYPQGSRVPTGVFALEGGVVQLRMDSGPDILLEGPAKLELDGVSRARLEFGKLVFRDDSGDDPFQLSTPWSELIDLGTEYAVSVTGDDEEVHVFSGAVERTGIVEGARSPAELLSDGQAMRYKQSVADSAEALVTEPEKFIREVDSDPQPDAARGVASESFDYDAASAMMENLANGGPGWNSPWRRNVPDFPGHNEQDLALRVGESLLFGSKSEASRGGSLGYVGHWLTHRELAEPLDLSANRVVYVSFLYRPTGLWQQGENSLRLMFFNPGEGVIEHRIAIALDAGRGIIRGALCGARKQCPLPMANESTYLIVAKIACSADNPDQLMLRVFQPDEPVGVREPASWTIVTPPIDSDDSYRLMSLLFHCEHEQRMDEIRLGGTWSSVTQAWAAEGVPAQQEAAALAGR